MIRDAGVPVLKVVNFLKLPLPTHPFLKVLLASLVKTFRYKSLSSETKRNGCYSYYILALPARVVIHARVMDASHDKDSPVKILEFAFV